MKRILFYVALILSPALFAQDDIIVTEKRPLKVSWPSVETDQNGNSITTDELGGYELEYRIDRGDWVDLISVAPDILATEIPAQSYELGQEIGLRIRAVNAASAPGPWGDEEYFSVRLLALPGKPEKLIISKICHTPCYARVTIEVGGE